MFRDYYGFTIGTEAQLTSPSFSSLSFEDTVRMVQNKALRVVKSLLQGHADPSVPQSRQSRKTPLHQCAEHGLTSLAEVLLEHRADPNARSMPLERTPLHSAVIHRSAGVVRALLASGADQGQKDSQGNSALEIARRCWVFLQ